MSESFDCVVMGGGPAGSTAAALIARAGFSTLLVERDKMPRFHVGESLMPETYWTLQRLGVLDRMKASKSPRKHSVQFVNEKGKASRPFYFQQHDERECSQTWQVLRSEFDQMLFDNAADNGAVCRDQTRVLDLLLDDADRDPPRAVGVTIQTADGARRDVASRVAIDATGQQSLVATRLGIRQEDPHLKKAAVWSYYRGATRDAGIDGGATIILHTQKKASWFWFIPLEDDLSSIGVVGDRDYLLKNRGTPEKIFAAELAICPALAQRLVAARRTDDFRVAREFSYKAQQAAGDGWVLVGDAYGFVDPVYSSGVFFALKSGELAADCVVEALHAGDVTAARLGQWAEDFDRGVDQVAKLVGAFYTNGFSFGRFTKAYPQHTGNLVDLLIGRIFDPGAGNIFQDMDPMLAEVRTAEHSGGDGRAGPVES